MKKTLAALFLALPVVAFAQAYPSKPIRWVVPYTGGGITDVVTPVVTQKMQASLGQAIVVENKPGANSIIGADLLAKAAPDGYSIVTVIAAHAANATLYQGKLPFDPVKRFHWPDEHPPDELSQDRAGVADQPGGGDLVYRIGLDPLAPRRL